MAKDNNNGANLGFESELWRAADALRSNMDAAEYKHVVLGLIFLKYISDAFEEQRAKLEADRAQGADPEDPDEYRAVNIFWVPKEARWSKLKSEAKQPTIGKVIDDAMLAIEGDNPSLKGVLPKDYAHPRLDKQRLGQLIDLVGNFGDISIYGQESNHTTWRLAKMNLAIRGIDGNLGKEHADTFHRDLHPDLKADYVIANPPFNDSDWSAYTTAVGGCSIPGAPRETPESATHGPGIASTGVKRRSTPCSRTAAVHFSNAATRRAWSRTPTTHCSFTGRPRTPPPTGPSFPVCGHRPSAGVTCSDRTGSTRGLPRGKPSTEASAPRPSATLPSLLHPWATNGSTPTSRAAESGRNTPGRSGSRPDFRNTSIFFGCREIP